MKTNKLVKLGIATFAVAVLGVVPAFTAQADTHVAEQPNTASKPAETSRPEVKLSEEINPEVLENYHIGHTLDLTSKETIVKGLEEFVHAIHNYPEAFSEGLIAANQKYSGKHLIQQILEG